LAHDVGFRLLVGSLQVAYLLLKLQNFFLKLPGELLDLSGLRAKVALQFVKLGFLLFQFVEDYRMVCLLRAFDLVNLRLHPVNFPNLGLFIVVEVC
jgi:hypothetical protein